MGTDPANYIRGDFPYAQSAEDLLVRMDHFGIDASVCFPFLYTSYLDFNSFLKGKMRKSRTGVCSVPYALENERLCQEVYEAYPQCAGKLLPFAFFDPSREQAGELPNCFVDFSAFHIHCDLAQQNSSIVAVKPARFRTSYSECVNAMATIAEKYPETMLWGTDSPYYCFMGRFTNTEGKTIITQLKCDTDAEINTFRELPKNMRQRIGYDNTVRYLLG